MIQRKQTLFLFLALVATVACLCLPVGRVEPEGMGVSPVLYNLGVRMQDGSINWSAWPLFAILVLTCPLGLAAIFLYKRRMLQAKVCVACAVIDVIWVGYLALYATKLMPVEGTFHLSFGSCLPIVAFILFLMARHGIIQDEKLVRSADRIR